MLRDWILANDVPSLKAALHQGDVDVLELCSLLRDAIGVGPEVTRLLLEPGADVNWMPENDFPPLHWAIEDGEPSVVRVLCEAGADLNRLHQGWTPLHCAIEMEMDIASNTNFEIQTSGYTEVLLECGADPFVESQDGLNALQLAIRCRHHQAVKLIEDFLASS